MSLPVQLTQASPAPQSPPPGNPASPEMQALLNQLKDIHEPAAIGWWPLAPGWWILAGVVIALLFAAGWLALRLREKKRRNLYRAEGMRLLRSVALDEPRAVEEINTLLKRVAVVTFGRDTCAPLTGQRWIQFLESSIEQPMPQAAQRTLLECLYGASASSRTDLEALRDFAIRWVREHQLPQAEAMQPTSPSLAEGQHV
ncbi:DUF4381 domain-containing protein [Microbulbifer mangrovi]|uniref:DUF4381 domain-containing protein n=1 Tax=Microbulbifer mangrovi TaxID=927787 RepID=UPI00099043F6|nr:DUF4381 domain-containing protein [Microbulbifer mangrovi]